MASANSNQAAEIQLHRAACKIILKQGDLLDETDVEAFVIPTPAMHESEKHNYALFNSLRSLADRELQRQIDNAREKVVLLEPQYIPKQWSYLHPFRPTVFRECQKKRESY